MVGHGHGFPVLGRQRLGFRPQRSGHLDVPRQHELDGRVRQRRGFLGNAGNADLAGQVDIALVGLDFIADGGEQAGFTRAVATHHAHAVTGVHGQVDVGQEQALAPAQGEIT